MGFSNLSFYNIGHGTEWLSHKVLEDYYFNSIFTITLTSWLLLSFAWSKSSERWTRRVKYLSKRSYWGRRSDECIHLYMVYMLWMLCKHFPLCLNCVPAGCNWPLCVVNMSRHLVLCEMEFMVFSVTFSRSCFWRATHLHTDSVPDPLIYCAPDFWPERNYCHNIFYLFLRFLAL